MLFIEQLVTEDRILEVNSLGKILGLPLLAKGRFLISATGGGPRTPEVHGDPTMLLQ